MSRKKEIILGIILIILVISFNAFFYLKECNKKPDEILEGTNDELNLIIIKIDGEVAQEIEVMYTKPLTYGALFLRIQNALNEFSDLSGYSFDEEINKSMRLTIPTKDVNNNYTPSSKILIHSASLEELMMLPQIGEKRGNKILEYIKEYGRIDSWETFFKIASVPENAKNQIKQQAIL